MRAALARHFDIISEVSVEDSLRTLFLLESTRPS
jgi:hypothetical protein